MLHTPALDHMLVDIADAFRTQFDYLKNNQLPLTSFSAYEAAIKDSVIGVATQLHKHIEGFSVDNFYMMCGYPGTHPVHAPKVVLNPDMTPK